MKQRDKQCLIQRRRVNDYERLRVMNLLLSAEGWRSFWNESGQKGNRVDKQRRILKKRSGHMRPMNLFHWDGNIGVKNKTQRLFLVHAHYSRVHYTHHTLEVYKLGYAVKKMSKPPNWSLAL
jgi:hypothetical protein